jgi:hypothetical protein
MKVIHDMRRATFLDTQVDPKMAFLTGILLGLPFDYLSGLSTAYRSAQPGASWNVSGQALKASLYTEG